MSRSTSAWSKTPIAEETMQLRLELGKRAERLLEWSIGECSLLRLGNRRIAFRRQADEPSLQADLCRSGAMLERSRPAQSCLPHVVSPQGDRWITRLPAATASDSAFVAICTISVSLCRARRFSLGSIDAARPFHFTPRSHAPPASFALLRRRRFGSARYSLIRSRRTFSWTFIFVVLNSWPSTDEYRWPRVASHRKQRR